MAGDSSVKTEKPTPKRLKEGIKQGQVARSVDIAAWAGLLALTFLLPLIIGELSDDLQVVLRTIPEITSDPSIPKLRTISVAAITTISLALVPFLVGVVLVTQVAGWIQGGARPYLKRIAPKASNISPAQAAKRIYGTRGLWELAKQILRPR